MSSLPALTPPQEQVLALISAGSTISEAAQSAGVHRNTVHNWINSAPHFRLALARARDAKALFWRDQAEELAASAVDTIRHIMTEESTPPGVRLKAAQSILALALAPPPEPQSPALPDLPPSDSVKSPDSPASFQSLAALPEEPQPTAAPRNVHNSAQSTPAGPSSPQPVRRDTPKVGRNDSCPCGSGKKFKRCCLSESDAVLSPVA